MVLEKKFGNKFKSDWTYGWHASRTGVVMYYYHVDQGIKFNSYYRILFIATLGGLEQNCKLVLKRTERAADDKSHIWYGYDKYPWIKTNYITWSGEGWGNFFSIIYGNI